jgi:hypothetical protein
MACAGQTGDTGQTDALRRSDWWHRSDRWTEPVRPVATTAALQMLHRVSMTSLGPGTKTPSKHNQQGRRTIHTTKQNTSNLDKNWPAPTRPKDTRVQQITRDKSHRGLTPVRPVVPGQLGMNRTRMSTLPNPTPDLPIRSTDSNKTLGIV